jgi:hypothetical protein
MCFVFVVSVSDRSPVPTRPASVARAQRFRLFALFIMLLGLVAQQRVLAPALRPDDSVVRLVAERVQSLETQAVRAEPALRIAQAPVFARVPSFSEPTVVRAQLAVRACAASPPLDRSYTSVSHFHSKRRIPRMNSEEPPRA